MALPAFLAPAAIGGFFKRSWPFMLAGAVGLILLLTYCEGRKAGSNAADLSRERGNVKMLENTAAASENAAAARLDDQERQQQEQAQLRRVTDNANDPAQRRRAFHRCLRDQQAARAAGRPAPVCQ
ncbi:MAG TPA: hypothetical protein VEC11_07845 [Allosphingosinicella sp.]|nr:hypothetical protein [Allosphingosinicella sp.]